MINLMYLVLTAMLALNISSEILNAFKTINDSIENTNRFVNNNNATLYNSIQAQSEQQEQAARVKPYNDKAKEVKVQADQIFNYLEGLKQDIIKQGGGIQKEGKEIGHIKKEGDIDVATRMFVEGRPNSKQGGNDLKKKLEDYRSFLINKVDEADKKDLNTQMPLALVNPPKSENNPDGDWAHGNFFHMPTIAAVTLLAKFQNDVRNAEGMTVQKLMDEAQVGVIKFNAIKAIAVPNQSYVRQGDRVSATILLGAYNRNINPRVSASSGSVTKTEEGVAYWETVANGLGTQKVTGSVTLDFNGTPQTKSYEFTYTVGSAGGSIQLDKMNVFYIGIENPVTISASGYNLEDADFVVPGATVTKTGLGHYSVKVSNPGPLAGSVRAKAQNGSVAEVAKMNIRAKFIPDPITKVGGKHGGVIAANVLKAQIGIVADLEDFLFEGVKYDVVSYSYSMKQKKSPDVTSPISMNGTLFQGQVKDLIQQVRAGDRVFFDDIRAKGPDGRVRQLGTLSFTVI